MFDENFKLDDHRGKYILVGQVGSKSYGIDIPESDDDYMGVAVAFLSHYTGLESWENSGTLKIDRKELCNAELTVFELKKFLHLCLGFNPNVIPLLYLRAQDYVWMSDGGNQIIIDRNAFTSRRAYGTMINYAKNQRKAVVNGDTGKLGMKRKELIKQFGYDVKYAAHTIRILRMGIEFFQTGQMNVYRTWDQGELRAIRSGRWQLTAWIQLVDELLLEATKAEKEGNLPDKPNFKLVNDLCMNIIGSYTDLRKYYD
jgi:predicted nucleotidyltransferase